MFDFYNNLSLPVKITLGIITVFALLMASVLLIVDNNTQDFIRATGVEQVRNEAEFVQVLAEDRQNNLRVSLDIAASFPGVAEALESQSLLPLLALADSSTAQLDLTGGDAGLDSIALFQADGALFFSQNLNTSVSVEVEAMQALAKRAIEQNERVNEVIQVEFETEQGETSQQFSLAFSRPIFDTETGTPLGAAVSTRILNLEYLNAVNRSSRVNIALVFNNEVRFQKLIEGSAVQLSGEPDPTTTNQFLGIPFSPAELNRALQGEIVVFDEIFMNADGIPVSIAYVPLEANSPAPVVLVLQLSLENLNEFRSDLTSQAAGLILLLALIGVCVLFFILRASVLSPLTRLRAVAGDISAGDYSKRVALQGKDAIGQLGNAFNLMADRVQKRDQEMHQLTTTLEHTVAERTGELAASNETLEQTNEQLLVTVEELELARDKAEEANRLKSEFLSVMSHELRTPLNSIMGNTGILMAGMAGTIDDVARGRLQRVQENSERLRVLIDDILDLARIESGRLELEIVPVTIRNLAENWQAELAPLAQQKELELKLEIDKSFPETIPSNHQHLTQIAINLLSNAIKFTESGSVTLSLQQGDDTYTLAVTDTGIGIPEDAIPYIFDTFRQVDGSTKRQYGGTGLGLAIAKRLAQLLGGDIEVTSEIDKGSTFTTRLPLKPKPTS